ncbi:TPA: hypothetical protein KNH13_001892 [Clostridioides difficile]|uniref:hypothetical protein n=2 Tax=Clostridioides difficile TaxID=1496 RepID=UPI000B3C2227|nr:hypothetical protein [Clostridioides difficile]MEC5403313.1 hypothetical protein [Clostridioides difficile]TLE39793.1 hypothetical protein EDC95_13740 [Clostridioides difficile]HBE9333771.1 hypothetical protein [Clostridioides difficile]
MTYKTLDEEMRVLEFWEYNEVFTKGRKEFIKDNEKSKINKYSKKIDKNNFSKDIKKTTEILGIDPLTLRSSKGTADFQIPILTEPLLKIMMETCRENPIYSNREIDIDDILNYNNIIYEKINKLPEDLQYEIKNTTAYNYNYNLNLFIPILVEKLDYLFKLALCKENIERGYGILELIQSLDGLIYNLKEKQMQEMDKSDNGIKKEFQNSTNSIIDSALKYSYNNQIALMMEVEKIVCNDKQGSIDKNKKMTRTEIIELIKRYNINISNVYSQNNNSYKDLENVYKTRMKKYSSLKLKEEMEYKKRWIDGKMVSAQKIKKINTKIKELLDKDIEHMYSKKDYMKLSCNIADLLLELGVDRDFLNSKFEELCEYIRYIIYTQDKYKIEIDISHIFRSEYNESRYSIEVLDEIINEFDNTRDRLERYNIKKYISKALGEALKVTLKEDLKNLKSNVYRIDDICFNYINTSRVLFHKNKSQEIINFFE